MVRSRWMVPVLACAAVFPLWAQEAGPQPAGESVDGMVRQLQGAPRTRSLRNIVVEQSASAPRNDAAAPDRPSLSLLVQFDFDSAAIRPESLPLLDKLSKALTDDRLGQARFAVEGHTDARGRADYNLALSNRRAESVRDTLIRMGVQPQRLVAVGKGSSEPARASDPLAAENRRVKVVNLE